MPRNVLVVDDEASIRDVLAVVLTDEGYAVRTAPDGAKALALHESAPADVVLSDVMMPVVDGIGLVVALRTAGDHTPVVLMSAAPPPPMPDGIGWLAKPFNLDAVVDAIAAALRRA